MKLLKQSTILAITCSALLAPVALSQEGAAPDPQMKEVLDELAKLGPKPLPTLTPEEARKQPTIADAAMAVMKKRKIPGPEVVGHTDDINIELSDHKIPARVYYPEGDGPFPVILYIHGGGWVIADLDVYDATPRALCNLTGAVVVSTHYRQAPEFKFPAAHEDVFGAYQWLFKNVGKYKGDSKKIAVLGESAGGNMAAAISMMAKEKGIQMPVAQVLVYPVADATKMDTPSYMENAAAKPLDKPAMAWFAKHALATPEDAKNPRLSLLLAGDELKGLPPTTIICAQIDPLRSEGEALGKALADAGVQVNQKTFMGVTHEFFGLGGVVDKAKEAEQMAAMDLLKAFGK